MKFAVVGMASAFNERFGGLLNSLFSINADMMVVIILMSQILASFIIPAIVLKLVFAIRREQKNTRHYIQASNYQVSSHLASAHLTTKNFKTQMQQISNQILGYKCHRNGDLPCENCNPTCPYSKENNR